MGDIPKGCFFPRESLEIVCHNFYRYECVTVVVHGVHISEGGLYRDVSRTWKKRRSADAVKPETAVSHPSSFLLISRSTGAKGIRSNSWTKQSLIDTSFATRGVFL